jgi:hypothetical protein
MSKPSDAEDEFFAKEEIEKRHKLATELKAKQLTEDAAMLKAAHFMHCPKCGNELSTVQFRGLDIDRCFHCHGTWLDEGELERLAGQDEQHKVLKAIVDAFRPSKK